MGDRVPAAVGGPTVWLVCFHVRCINPWIRFFLPGPYKHVSAVGWVPQTGTWVYYDPAMDRTRIWASRDDAAGLKVLGEWIDDAMIVRYRPPAGLGSGMRFRWGFWCVPAVAHLLGLSCGAVTPRGLLRSLLRNGGEIVANVQGPAISAVGAGSSEAGAGE